MRKVTFLNSCLVGAHIVNDVIRMREVKDKSKTLEIPLSSWAKEILGKYNYNLSNHIRTEVQGVHQRNRSIIGFT